jgi:hypothetical protein
MANLKANIKEQSITLISTKSTTINLYVKTSSARVKVLSFDGSITSYKSSSPSTSISISLIVPDSGTYSGSSSKTIKVYGNTRIKYFDCSNNSVTSLSVASAPEIETLITS